MSLREARKLQTRTRIADVAAGLFAEHGFHAVTVDEVARVAGVSKQTVFNHFASKEELVFDRMSEVREAMLTAVRDRPPGQPLVEAFRAHTRAMWERVATLAEDRPQHGFFQIVHETPSLQAYLRRVGAEIVEELAAAIAQDAGADPEDQRPHVAAVALAAAHTSVFDIARMRIATGERPRDFVPELLARADAAYDLLGDGLAGYP